MAYVQTEINEQVIPAKVMGKLESYYRHAHSQLHRGTLSELYDMYVEGVADGLEIDKNTLCVYLSQEFSK